MIHQNSVSLPQSNLSATYHIRNKKEYSKAVIEDLRKNDAVEFIPEEEAFDVPQWQKNEVLRRIEKHKTSPEQIIDEDTFFAMLNDD